MAFKSNQCEPDFKEIQPQDPEYLSNAYVKASHVLLYCSTSKTALKTYKRISTVLMLMRFDGHVGFPGGLVEEGEDPWEGVTRELVEEINYDEKSLGPITNDEHLFAHFNPASNLVLHFFGKELTESQMDKLINNSPKAVEFGEESLGLLLVPLYTMSNGVSGFPTFLRNSFVGNAKTQLIKALVQLKILDETYVQESLAISNKR